MKRLVILLTCITLLTSCTHRKHSYSIEWAKDEMTHYKECQTDGCGERIAIAEHSFTTVDGSLVCTVCQYEKPVDNQSEHAHTPAEGYTMSSARHWRACTECNERLEESEHSFGEKSVITPPTSDTEGLAERYCTVCGKGSTLTLDRLPEKMSEEEWRLAFTLDNVRIQERSKSGSLSSVDNTYEVDGSLVATLIVTDKGISRVYESIEALELIDLSDYYESFSHHGGGVYKSESLDLVTSGGKIKIQDAVIVFTDGAVSSVSYTIKLAAFGAVSYSYTFYDRGEVSLTPTVISTELLRFALSAESFSGNMILSYEQYDASGKYSEYQLTVTDGRYLCKSYQNGIYKGMTSGDSDTVGAEISVHLSSIFDNFSTDRFIYQEYYDSYTYIGEGVSVPELGTVSTCDLTVTDGLLSSISIELNDGSLIYYEFSYL